MLGLKHGIINKLTGSYLIAFDQMGKDERQVVDVGLNIKNFTKKVHVPDYVRFIERNARAADGIRSNARDLDVDESVDVVAANALTADLAVGGPYGLVLADPPYAEDPWTEFFRRLREPSVLEPASLVVAEYSSRREAPAAPPGWTLWKTRTHGDVEFTVYRLDEPPA